LDWLRTHPFVPYNILLKFLQAFDSFQKYIPERVCGWFDVKATLRIACRMGKDIVEFQYVVTIAGTL
jgi:hypothetical protein